MTIESNKSAAESSRKNKEKDNQNIDKQSQPTSSTSPAASAPDKTIPKPIHSENQHTELATKAVDNKIEFNIAKCQALFNLES